MPHKLKYTDDQLLGKARDFYRKNKRVPRQSDYPGGLLTTIKKRIGNWDTYINRAIGKHAAYRYWEESDLLIVAQEFWNQHNRFPGAEEDMVDGRSIRKVVLMYFASANDWLEKAIGTSPRITILTAIKELTPPGCEEATPAEILTQIRKTMTFPTNLLSFNSRQLCEDGYIIGGKYDRTRWWRLTPVGRTFLNSFVATHRSASAEGDKHAQHK
jgi:hypothetical protein